MPNFAVPERSLAGSPKRLARIAGLLYLVVGILGAFAFAAVYTTMYVAGDAAATASNLVANAGLVRIGVAADLVQVTVCVLLSLTLYALLRHVSAYAARAMVVLVAIGASISCINILFEFVGMRTATDAAYLAAGTAGRERPRDRPGPGGVVRRPRRRRVGRRADAHLVQPAGVMSAGG